MYKDITTDEMEKLISLKKVELSELFKKQGLNNLVIEKSRELDVLILEIQTRKLMEYKIIRNNINKK